MRTSEVHKNVYVRDSTFGCMVWSKDERYGVIHVGLDGGEGSGRFMLFVSLNT